MHRPPIFDEVLKEAADTSDPITAYLRNWRCECLMDENRMSIQKAIAALEEKVSQLKEGKRQKTLTDTIARIKQSMRTLEDQHKKHLDIMARTVRHMAVLSRKRYEIRALPEEGPPLQTSNVLMTEPLRYKQSRKN